MSDCIEKTNLSIEEVDHTSGTFRGFVYFSHCPPKLLRALKLPRLDPSTDIDIEGTFETEFDEGWPIALAGLRLWLVVTLTHSDGSTTPNRVEIMPYDLIEGGLETLEESVLGAMDLDGAAAAYRSDQQDQSDLQYEAWREEK
jgi:hypothetical protein